MSKNLGGQEFMVELEQIRSILKEKQSKLEALRASADKQLAALLKELQGALQSLQSIESQTIAADNKIRDQKEQINHKQEKLTQLREAVVGLEAKIAELYTILGDEQQRVAKLEASLLERQGRIEVAEEESKQRKDLLAELEEKGKEQQLEIGRRKEEYTHNLERQKAELLKAQEGIQHLREKNPIADYLLAEGSEPPELDIIALLIQKEEVPLEELKRVVKVPPALATRTIGNLETKGILKVSDKGLVRLVESL